MIEIAVGVFIAVAFAPQIFAVIAPGILSWPVFWFVAAAGQAICALVMCFGLPPGIIWVGGAALILLAAYNLWRGLQLRKRMMA